MSDSLLKKLDFHETRRTMQYNIVITLVGGPAEAFIEHPPKEEIDKFRVMTDF